jgi:hypothetical protein
MELKNWIFPLFSLVYCAEMAAAVLVTEREAAGVAAPVLTVAAAAQLWLALLALAVRAFLSAPAICVFYV